MAGDIDDRVIQIGEKALQIDFKALKVTAQLLRAVIKKMLSGNGTEIAVQGEQSMRQLRKAGDRLEQVPISAADLKVFRKELRKMDVDYSLLRQKGTDNYSVFFKGRDISCIRTALEHCISNVASDRRPMHEVLQSATERAAQRAEQSAERLQDGRNAQLVDRER